MNHALMNDLQQFPFSFNPAACETCHSACCRWGGYVWVTEEDIQAMAVVMKINLEEFANTYVKAAYGRLSLQERLRDGEYHCCLLDPFQNRCLVYEVRPKQCRSFPFWEAYREEFNLLLEICPGVSVKGE